MGSRHRSLPGFSVPLGCATSTQLLQSSGPDVVCYSEMADPSKNKMRTSLRLGGLLGFVGGFLMAYQRSSCES